MALITQNENSQRILQDLLEGVIKSSQQIKEKTEQQKANNSNAQLEALLQAIDNVNNELGQNLAFQIENITDIKAYKEDIVDSAKDFVDNYNNVIQQFIDAKENYEQQLTEGEKTRLNSFLNEVNGYVQELALIKNQEDALANLLVKNTNKLQAMSVQMKKPSLGDIITEKINQFHFYDNNPFEEVKKIHSLSNIISEREKQIKKIAPAVNNEELINNILQTFDMIKINVSKNKQDNEGLTETQEEAKKVSLFKNIKKLEQQSNLLIDNLTDNVDNWEKLGVNPTDVFKTLNDVVVKHLKTLEMSVIEFPRELNWQTKGFDEVKIHEQITKLNDRYILYMQEQSEKFFEKLNSKDPDTMRMADDISNKKRYVRLTNQERAINVFDMESPTNHNALVFNDKFRENFENMRRVLALNNNSRKNALNVQRKHNKKTKLNSDITAHSDAYAVQQTQSNEAVLQTSKSANKSKWLPISKMGSNNVAMAKQMVNTISQSIHNTTVELNIQKTIDPNSKIVKALEKQRQELEKEKEDWEKSLSGDNYKFFKSLFSNFTSAPAFLDKALGLLGLGGLFSVKGFVNEVINRYKENGKLLYQDAMTNASIGVGLTSGSRHRVFELGNKYWKMSGGRIMPETFVANYADLAKNVGGAYGASKDQVASDLDYLNHQFTVRQAVLGIDSGDLGVWYKSNKKSAEETIGIIDRITSDAQNLNVPVKTYMKIISGLGEQMRNLGTDATFAIPMIKGLVSQGMRVEDAKHVVGQVLGVQSHERDNMSSAYYGMLNGEGTSIYDVYVQGQLTHDSNGDVIGNQYERMGSRLLTKLNMFSGSFGQGTPQGMMATLQVLKQEGFDQQTISQLAPMVANGDVEGMAKILEGKDSGEDEFNKNQALENKLATYEEALKNATKQLSIKEQLEQARMQTINQVATQLEISLGGKMNAVRDIFHNVTSNIDEQLQSLVEQLGEISKKPWAQALMKLWVTDPLKVLAGGALAYGVGKGALKYGGKFLWNRLKNAKFGLDSKPKIKDRRQIFEERQAQQNAENANRIRENRSSIFGNNNPTQNTSPHPNKPIGSNAKMPKFGTKSKVGAVLALGTGMLTYAGLSDEKLDEDKVSKEELQEKVDNASEESFLNMFATGESKVRVVDEQGNLKSRFSIFNSLNDNAGLLALLTTTVGVASAFAFKKRTLSKLDSSTISNGAKMLGNGIKNNAKMIAGATTLGVTSAIGLMVGFSDNEDNYNEENNKEENNKEENINEENTNDVDESNNENKPQKQTKSKQSNINLFVPKPNGVNNTNNNHVFNQLQTNNLSDEEIEEPSVFNQNYEKVETVLNGGKKPFEYYNKEDGIEKFKGNIQISLPSSNPAPVLSNRAKNNLFVNNEKLQANGMEITDDMIKNGINPMQAKDMFPNYDINQIYSENSLSEIPDKDHLQTIKCVMNLSNASKSSAKLYKNINADDVVSAEELKKMFESNDEAYKDFKDYMQKNGFDYENMTDIEKDIFKEMIDTFATGESTLASLLKLLITAKQDYDAKVKQINGGKGFGNGGGKLIDSKGNIQQLKQEVKDKIKKEWDKELEEGQTNLMYADLALKKYNEATSQEDKNKYSGLNTYLKVIAGEQSGLDSLVDELHADLNNKKYDGKKVYGATKVSFDNYDALVNYAKQIGGEDTLSEIMDTWKKRWDDEKNNLYAYGYELKLMEAAKNKENLEITEDAEDEDYIPIDEIGAYDPGFGPGAMFKNAAYAIAQRTGIPLELIVALAWSEQGGSQSTWEYGNKLKNWFGIIPTGNDRSVVDSAGTNRTATFASLERSVNITANTLDDDGYRTTSIDKFMQTLVKNGYVEAMQVGDEKYKTKRNSMLAGLKVAKAWGMTSNTVSSFVTDLGVGNGNVGGMAQLPGFLSQKSLTIKETNESMQNRYLNSIGGIHGKLGKRVQGAIIGGSKIDTTQRFKSVAEIKNEYLYGKTITHIPAKQKTVTNAPSADKTAHTIEKLTQQQLLFKKFEEHKERLKNEKDNKYADTAIMNITGQMKKGKKYKDMMKEINSQIESLNCSVEQDEKLSGGLTM